MTDHHPANPDDDEICAAVAFDPRTETWVLYAAELGDPSASPPVAVDDSEDAPPDDLETLLALALDGHDLRRVELLTQLYMLTLDADREADLERLRREGTPPMVWW